MAVKRVRSRTKKVRLIQRWCQVAASAADLFLPLLAEGIIRRRQNRLNKVNSAGSNVTPDSLPR